MSPTSSQNRQHLARRAAVAAALSVGLLVQSALAQEEEDDIPLVPPPVGPGVLLPEDDPAFMEIMQDVDPELLEELARVLGEENDLFQPPPEVDPFFNPRIGNMIGSGRLAVPQLSSGMVKTDTDAETLLGRAEAFAKQDRYDLASRLWQQAINQSGDALIERDEWVDQTFRGNIYRQLRPMLGEIEASMGRTIQDSLESYQLKIDGDARALLARASAEERESALSEVILRYFLSSVGDDAAFELGCLKMERGEFLPAVRLFTKVLDEYPEPTVDRVQLEIRLAGSLARVGNIPQALEIVDALYEEYAEHRRVLDLVRADIEAVRDLQQGDSVASRGVLTTPVEVHPILQNETLPDHLQIGWTQRFELRLPADWAVLPETTRDPLPEIFNPFQNAQRRNTPQPKPAPLTERWREMFLPVGQVLTRDGKLFFKTDDRVVSCDAASGQLEWLSFRYSLVLDENTQLSTRRYRTNTVTVASYPTTPEEFLLFGDHVNQSMTLSGNALYSLHGKPLDYTEETTPQTPTNAARQRQRFGIRANAAGRFRENRLVAYDAQSGKIKWYRNASEPVDPRMPIQKRAGFSRAPLPYGSFLLVPVHEESSLWLAALRQDTGETVWRTFLCDEPSGECQGLSTVSLSIDAGEAYVASGAGILFSLDAVSGKLNWAVRYPRKAKNVVTTTTSNFVPRYGTTVDLLDGFRQDHALTQGNHVIMAGTDFNYLFAVNRRTGKLSWEAAQQPFRSQDPSSYVMAAHKGRIYVGGSRTIRCYQSRGGKMVWEAPLPSPSYGRGAFTEKAIYVPLKQSIAQLDPTTGAVVAMAHVASPPSKDEPIGNLFTDGERLIVFGLKKVYALVPASSTL